MVGWLEGGMIGWMDVARDRRMVVWLDGWRVGGKNAWFMGVEEGGRCGGMDDWKDAWLDGVRKGQ
jgi:hypothetical protein